MCIDNFNKEDPFAKINPAYMKNYIEKKILTKTNKICPHEITDLIIRYGLPIYTSHNLKAQKEPNEVLLKFQFS